MKQKYLVRMLEWLIECDHDWSLPMGWLGKGLKRHLTSEMWSSLAHTYAGASLEESWDALFAMIALFRQAATSVADDLGYLYPHDLDARVTAYAQQVHAMRDHLENA